MTESSRALHSHGEPSGWERERPSGTPASQCSAPGARRFVAYEYKDITVENRFAPYYIDGYENFGWQCDEPAYPPEPFALVTLHLKRDRHIVNRMELTRLQRQFEAGIAEVRRLEESKAAYAVSTALMVGIFGLAFMAGAVFAALATPPMIWLTILLSLVGLVGLALPIFLYRSIYEKRSQVVEPLLDAKYQEIMSLFEKGHRLLHV